jgi:hypothetical protein
MACDVTQLRWRTVASVAALFLAACGGGGGESTSNGGGGTPAPSGSSYTVGGTVAGLSGTVVLQDNHGDNFSVTANGAFSFATPVPSGSAYSVTVYSQPAGQNCSVVNGAGSISAAAATDVAVSCASTTNPTVSVTISPTSASLAPGETRAFTATVSGTTNSAVTWSVTESAGGTVDSTGHYTAPASTGNFHVIATSHADATKSATATVTVTATTPPDTSLLPADRRTLWQPGVTYNGGIPVRTINCASLSPLGGGQDDTTQIQDAIDACPDNQVVKLAPGTFRITGNGLFMKKSNVTLRGAGPASTILSKDRNTVAPVVTIGQDNFIWVQQTDLLTDALKETNSVTLVSNPGLRVGEIVHVDEQHDPALVYFNPVFQTNDYLGWGENRFNHAATAAQAQTESRPIGQAMEIASINGNAITFTTNFHIDLRTSHHAHLARIARNDNVVSPDMKYIGIEDMAVEYGDGGDGGGNIQVVAPAAYSWIKHVESRFHVGGSVCFHGSFRGELRDSYLHEALDPNPGGGGYGVEVETYAADNLVENNIVWAMNKLIAMRSSGGGNVIGYNYMDDGYGAGYPQQQEVGLNASHMAGSHYELFEGNYSFNFDSDSHWGTQLYITVFRNQLSTKRAAHAPLDNYVWSPSGLQAQPAGTPFHLYYEDAWSRRAIGLTKNQYWYSFVGNVLGTPDIALTQSPPRSSWADFAPLVVQDSLAYENLDAMGNSIPMWMLGYDGDDPGAAFDKQVLATTLRVANFDYVTRKVHWHGIGGSGANNGLTPPSTSTLPDSLYLTGKPSFFGGIPWPYVDGSNAANPLPGSLPAKTRFDAGTPNTL